MSHLEYYIKDRKLGYCTFVKFVDLEFWTQWALNCPIADEMQFSTQIIFYRVRVFFLGNLKFVWEIFIIFPALPIYNKRNIQ